MPVMADGTLRPVLPVLAGAPAMLALRRGIRQSFGLFVQPMAHDLALTVAQLAFALSLQNLAWGVVQPAAGALAARFGFRPVLLGGTVGYAVGLGLLAS